MLRRTIRCDSYLIQSNTDCLVHRVRPMRHDCFVMPANQRRLVHFRLNWRPAHKWPDWRGNRTMSTHSVYSVQALGIICRIVVSIVRVAALRPQPHTFAHMLNSRCAFSTFVSNCWAPLCTIRWHRTNRMCHGLDTGTMCSTRDLDSPPLRTVQSELNDVHCRHWSMSTWQNRVHSMDPSIVRRDDSDIIHMLIWGWRIHLTAT